MSSPLPLTVGQIRRYFETRLPGQRIGSRREIAVKCPFHPDSTASMSIRLAEGVWFCHACNEGGGLLEFEKRRNGGNDKAAWEAIYAAVGAQPPERSSNGHKKQEAKFYTYREAAGAVVYEVARFPGKQFRQRRPDGKGGWVWNLKDVERVLYHLPELQAADLVFVAEGEKDCETLTALHLDSSSEFRGRKIATTCNSGGAGKWRREDGAMLKGKDVLVFEDNDDAGRAHASQVLVSVRPHAKSCKLIRLPELPVKGDVSDWVATHSVDELVAEIQRAPEWSPDDVQEGGPKLVRLGELLARPVVPVDWRWEGRLSAGSLSLLVAKPKVGKSTLARNLALAIARGESCMGWPTRRGLVLYFCLEERSEDIASDFRAMGANGSEDLEIADAGTVVDAVSLVQKKKPALVVVDPLFRLVSIRDERGYAEVYGAIGPLIDVSRQTGSHLLLLHHSSKLAKAEAIDAPLGSTALGGAVSTVMVMRRTETFRTLQTVQRLGQDLEETTLEFDPATKRLSLGGTREEAEIRAVQCEILGCLESASGPLSEPEINDNVEGRTMVQRQALRGLVARGDVERIGSGRRGDPFRYRQIACSLVPDPAKNIGNKKATDTTPREAEGNPKKLVPEVLYTPGNKGTRNENCLRDAESTPQKLVPDTSRSGADREQEWEQESEPDEVRL